MTVRNAIINMFMSDLLKINTANGYTRTVSTVEYGSLDISKINDFDKIKSSFSLGADIEEGAINEGILNTEVSALFQVYIESNADIDKENLIIVESEEWLKNLNWYFYGGNGIDISSRCALKSIPGVSRYVIKARDPMYSANNTRQSVAILLRIFYKQFKGQTIPATPALVLPAQVTLVSPADGYTTGDIGNADFQWQAAANAETYHFQISTDINFVSPVYQQDNLLYLKHTVIDGLLQNDIQYYWRVRARNSAGYGPWSEVISWKSSNELSLANLAFWGDSTLGITDEIGKVRRWDSQQSLTSWFGQPTAGLQPVNGGVNGISFDITGDILLENDFGTNIAGTIFYGDTNREWTVLIWEKVIASANTYAGLWGLNQYSGNRLERHTTARYFKASQWLIGNGLRDSTFLQADSELNDNWILNVGIWNKELIRNLVYDKNKIIELDIKLEAIGDSYSTNNLSLKFFPYGRSVRYLVIFKRALTQTEIEKFFDDTIANIPS